MNIIIIKPTEKKIIENVNWVEIETINGNFVIQPEHAPMILTLKQNKQIIIGVDNFSQELVPVKTGIAHITRNSVTFLLSE